MTTAARVREALRAVVDPCSAATGSNLDVVEMGLLKSVTVEGDHVDVALRLTTPACHMVPYFVREVETRVGALEGVDSVDVATDAGTEWSEDLLSPAARAKRRATLEGYAERYGGDA